jgi:IclR family acetate operon transcriptional repressor
MRSAPSADAVSVIDRVVLVLGCFRAEDERLGVSELARRAHLPKSTVSRLVHELVGNRYLERDGAGVRLGLRLFELGQLATRPNALRALAVETMADLRDEIGETVQLAVLDGSDVLCLGVVHASRGLRHPAGVGMRSAARLSAGGKVLLAHSPSTVMAGLDPRDAAALAVELAEIRERGIAFDVDTGSGRIVGVAGAVLAGGEAVAAVSASGAAETFDPWRVTPAVRAAALALTRRAS